MTTMWACVFAGQGCQVQATDRAVVEAHETAGCPFALAPPAPAGIIAASVHSDKSIGTQGTTDTTDGSEDGEPNELQRREWTLQRLESLKERKQRVSSIRLTKSSSSEHSNTITSTSDTNTNNSNNNNCSTSQFSQGFTIAEEIQDPNTVEHQARPDHVVEAELDWIMRNTTYVGKLFEKDPQTFLRFLGMSADNSAATANTTSSTATTPAAIPTGAATSSSPPQGAPPSPALAPQLLTPGLTSSSSLLSSASPPPSWSPPIPLERSMTLEGLGIRTLQAMQKMSFQDRSRTAADIYLTHLSHSFKESSSSIGSGPVPRSDSDSSTSTRRASETSSLQSALAAALQESGAGSAGGGEDEGGEGGESGDGGGEDGAGELPDEGEAKKRVGFAYVHDQPQADAIRAQSDMMIHHLKVFRFASADRSHTLWENVPNFGPHDDDDVVNIDQNDDNNSKNHTTTNNNTNNDIEKDNSGKDGGDGDGPPEPMPRRMSLEEQSLEAEQNLKSVTSESQSLFDHLICRQLETSGVLRMDYTSSTDALHTTRSKLESFIHFFDQLKDVSTLLSSIQGAVFQESLRRVQQMNADEGDRKKDSRRASVNLEMMSLKMTEIVDIGPAFSSMAECLVFVDMAGQLCESLRVKVSDDGDLAMARTVVLDAHDYFNQLEKLSKMRDTNPITLIDQLIHAF